VTPVQPVVGRGGRFATRTRRPAAGHVTRSAPGTGKLAEVSFAAARHKPLPLCPTTPAVVASVFGHVGAGTKRVQLDGRAGARGRAMGGPVARQTLNSTSHLPEEGAHGSPAVDHVQQWIDGAMAERHDLTERQSLVQLDPIVGVDPDKTDDEVRRPAEQETDDDEHRHLNHGPLRRQRNYGFGRRTAAVGAPAVVRLEAGSTTQRRLIVRSAFGRRTGSHSGLVRRHEVNFRSIDVEAVAARTSARPAG